MIPNADITQLARQYLKGPGQEEGLTQKQVVRLLRWISSEDLETVLLKAANQTEQPQQRAIPPGVTDLTQVLIGWGLSKAEAAERIFGLSRQAIGKWLKTGVPQERLSEVAKLAAATDLLLRHLKAERIPSIVRRPAPARGNRSLLEIAHQEGADAVLSACREMFDFTQANFPKEWTPDS